MSDTAPIFIRTVSKQDLETVQVLLKDTWHHTYDSIHGKQKVNEMTAQMHDLEALQERRIQPLSEFIVADTGSKIVGVAFAAQLGKIVFLHQLYVAPSHQRNGVGKELLQELFFCFDSAEKMALEVDAKNKNAIAFYEQNEFVKAGETDNCASPDSGIKALVFERPLQE
ncbi:MAG: GNAT family N-acetyltransferase [Rhizobiales bacterium]|nr:GNAT family N-acetyltransferase [Hyphomicrobiales bacterium]